MPPQILFDISQIDLDRVVYDQEAIREVNPQRGPMEMLNGIVHADAERNRVIGFKDVRSDEFWVPWHVPGRPLFPGVLMVESAAQLASFYTRKFMGWTGFIGFGGIEECRFRLPVTPPCRMHVMAERIWHRHGRVCCKEQGIVAGNLVFEATIIGTRV